VFLAAGGVDILSKKDSLRTLFRQRANNMSVSSDWIQKALSRHEVSLIRYAVSILGDLDRARDVVQDTFLQLCKEKPEKLEGHLTQWLFRVCRNRALDMRRKEGRMKVVADDQVELRDQSPGPAVLLHTKERLSRVHGLLDDLPENQREVIRLKFQSGMSYQEISEVTGLSVSNVGFLLHTAIKTLRKRVKKDPPAKSQIRRIK
jgi:RNA polymerase sigma-70 factor (ECF subfamily)